MDESCVARDRVQQRTAKSDEYGQELDALFTEQRAFEDHIASLECDAEYGECVAEKEWLGLMPLLRNSLFQIKEQLALALKRLYAPSCRISGTERFSCCLTLSRMWNITR